MNVAIEREFPLYLPESVAMHCNRLSRPDFVTTPGCGYEESVERAAHDLAQANPRVILFGCTSGSFLVGLGREEEIAQRITLQTGIPAFTTSTAVVEALRAVSARNVFLITPYPAEVNAREIAFLEHYGFRVVGHDSFLCATSELIPTLSSDDVAAMALRNRAEMSFADVLFVSCTNLLTMDRIADLESGLGKAVITSNQASLWLALQQIGVREIRRLAGQLFQLGTAAMSPNTPGLR
jgi:maleate isomerase